MAIQIVFPSGGELTVAVNGNRKEFLNIWYRAAADDYLNSEGGIFISLSQLNSWDVIWLT